MTARPTRWLPLILLGSLWLAFFGEYLFTGRIYVAETARALGPNATTDIDLGQSYQAERSLHYFPEWVVAHRAALSEVGTTREMDLLSPEAQLNPMRRLVTAMMAPWVSPEGTYMTAMMLRSWIGLVFVFGIFRHFGIQPLWAAAATAAFWFTPPMLNWHLRPFTPLYLYPAAIYLVIKSMAAIGTRRATLLLSLSGVLALIVTTGSLYAALGFLVVLSTFAILVAHSVAGIRFGNSLLRGLLLGCGVVILSAALSMDAIWAYVVADTISSAPPRLSLHIPISFFYLPHLETFQNALDLFTTSSLHPVSPALKKLVGTFDTLRMTLYLGTKSIGQIDGVYQSILWYLLLPLIWLDRKTREQSRPFWMTFLICLALGNLGAVASRFLGLNSAFWRVVYYVIPIATHTVLTATIGFSVIAFGRLLPTLREQVSWSLLASIKSALPSRAVLSWMAAAPAAMAAAFYFFWPIASDQIAALTSDAISRAYAGTLPGSLTGLIRGGYPLSHYLGRVDAIVTAIGGLGFFVAAVLVPAGVLTFLVIRRPVPQNDISGRVGKYVLLACLAMGLLVTTSIAVGRNIRLSAPSLADELSKGLTVAGVDATVSAASVSELSRNLMANYAPLPTATLLLLASSMAIGLAFTLLIAYPRMRPWIPAVIALLCLQDISVLHHWEDHARDPLGLSTRNPMAALSKCDADLSLAGLAQRRFTGDTCGSQVSPGITDATSLGFAASIGRRTRTTGEYLDRPMGFEPWRVAGDNHHA